MLKCSYLLPFPSSCPAALLQSLWAKCTASWGYGAQVRGSTFGALNASFWETATGLFGKLQTSSDLRPWCLCLCLRRSCLHQGGKRSLGSVAQEVSCLWLQLTLPMAALEEWEHPSIILGTWDFGAASGVSSAAKMSTSVVKIIAQNRQFSNSQLNW